MLPMDCQIQAEGKIPNSPEPHKQMVSNRDPNNPLILEIPIQTISQPPHPNNARVLNPLAALEFYLQAHGPRRFRRSPPLY